MCTGTHIRMLWATKIKKRKLTRRATNIIVILALITIMFSCGNLTPAGFWKDYQSDQIQSNKSDQGPWGGYSELTWKTTESSRFKNEDIIKYATKNGWAIIDSLNISKNGLTKINPELNTENYADDVLNSKINSDIKWSDFIVYRFKTGWIKIEPGNARETDKNGIIAIKTDRTEMYVYHFWGE
jgi:hypothetical protein